MFRLYGVDLSQSGLILNCTILNVKHTGSIAVQSSISGMSTASGTSGWAAED